MQKTKTDPITQNNNNNNNVKDKTLRPTPQPKIRHKSHKTLVHPQPRLIR